MALGWGLVVQNKRNQVDRYLERNSVCIVTADIHLYIAQFSYRTHPPHSKGLLLFSYGERVRGVEESGRGGTTGVHSDVEKQCYCSWR